MSCINGFLPESLDWGEIQCWITTLVLQTGNCILEKLQHWLGAQRKPVQIRNVSQKQSRHRGQICSLKYLSSTNGHQISLRLFPSQAHTNKISNHYVINSKPNQKSLAHRNWRKCSFKAANNVIYTCWEFDPIHSLHAITQTINHWNCQILYIFNGRSKQSSRL